MTHSLLLPEETATAAGHGLCPLRCPDCGATPTFAPTPTQPLPGGWFGVLRCDCHTDPVLDSIPILRRGPIDVQDHVTGRTEIEGPDHDTLVAMLRGRPRRSTRWSRC